VAEREEARYQSGDEAGALSRIDPEQDNIRATLRHFLASVEAELAARLAGAVGKFWFFRGHLNEPAPRCVRCWRRWSKQDFPVDQTPDMPRRFMAPR